MKSIVEIGYEIGNREDCNILLSDIAVQQRDIGALDPMVLTDNQLRIKSIDAIIGLLEIGIYYRDHIGASINPASKSRDDKPGDSNETPDAFTDFLNSLDI